MATNFKIDRTGQRLNRKPKETKFEPSVTVASHAVGITVKEIVARFKVTGTIPSRVVPGQFLDTTIAPSMFEALNMRAHLEEYFDHLPSGVRGHFANDPLKLVAFVNDPKNFNDALNMGLLELNDAGKKAKADWASAQSKLDADKRSSFVADVAQILKSQQDAGK